MVTIETYKAAIGGFSSQVASCGWRRTVKASGGYRIDVGLRVSPLIAAYLNITSSPHFSYPSKIVTEESPRPSTFLATILSGSSPGLSETLAQVTARVRVIMSSGDIEINPGPDCCCF